jgi:GDP/UDP-N,N'-diacetylbacillosamine 2-epimerase (hydrolysing)
MIRKICIITGSRADYGLLKLTMQEISNDPDLTLQIIVTGTHLSSLYGETYTELLADGFKIDKKIEILNADNTSQGIAESVGLGINRFHAAYKILKPDLVLVLGDRYEIFAAATAAHIGLIPLAHIHGGEITEGVIDDAFRHAITKMSQVHFVSTKEYAARVIQLGEQPSTVHVTGGLGVDALSNLKLLSKSELQTKLGFQLGEKNLLITFHPSTLEFSTAEDQISELLKALSKLTQTTLIFTMANADSGGLVINQLVKDFTERNINAKLFPSLGQLAYFSCIPFMDGVVGNSSSGILEVPSFSKGTINIGDRQRGRIQAKSVINCLPNYQEIHQAIETLYSVEFQKNLINLYNPYEPAGASKKIVKTIKKTGFSNSLKKVFYDLDFVINKGENK